MRIKCECKGTGLIPPTKPKKDSQCYCPTHRHRKELDNKNKWWRDWGYKLGLPKPKGA